MDRAQIDTRAGRYIDASAIRTCCGEAARGTTGLSLSDSGMGMVHDGSATCPLQAGHAGSGQGYETRAFGGLKKDLGGLESKRAG